MKREILTLRRGDCGCCPGHDTYACETYNSNRSHRARSRDIRKEHKHARSIAKRRLFADFAFPL